MILEAEVMVALPSQGFLHDYVHHAAYCTDAPAAYHVGVGLALLAQTAPVGLHASFGGVPIYTNIFVMLVGPSTDSRKSASINVGRRILRDLAPNAEAEAPGSPQGLVEGLRGNPRQLIVYEEFGAFLAQTERGQMSPIKTALNDLADAVPIGRALAKSRAGAIRDPRLSIVGGVTPDYLERHTEPVDWTGGFLSRFFTLYASRERTYDLPPGDPAGRNAAMMALKQIAQCSVYGDFNGFTQEATARWIDWNRSVTSRPRPEDVNGAVGRAPGFALKIATLLSWDYGEARSGRPWQIDLAVLEPAIRIAELHLKSVLSIGATLATSPDMRDRRTVLFAIAQHGPVGQAALITRCKMLNKRFTHVLATLQNEHLIELARTSYDAGDLYYTLSDRGRSFLQSLGVTLPPPAPLVGQPVPTFYPQITAPPPVPDLYPPMRLVVQDDY